MTQADLVKMQKEFLEQNGRSPEFVDFSRKDWIGLINWDWGKELNGEVTVHGPDVLLKRGTILGLKIGRTDAEKTRVY